MHNLDFLKTKVIIDINSDTLQEVKFVEIKNKFRKLDQSANK